MLAKGVLGGRTSTIGIIVPDIQVPPTITANVAGAITAFREAGFRALLFVTDYDPELEYEEIRQAAMRRVDGILLWGARFSSESGHLQELLLREIPTVIMARPVDNVPFDVVTGKDFDDGYLLTQKLIEKGHRRIAHITLTADAPSTAAYARTAGWTKALEDAGIKVDRGLLLEWPGTDESIVKRVGEWLDLEDPPTALFIGGQHQLPPVLDLLRRRNLRMPDDISVATFIAGTRLNNALSLGGIGGIITASSEIGRAAAMKLLALIEAGGPSDAPTELEIAGTWADGNSTGPVPARSRRSGTGPSAN